MPEPRTGETPRRSLESPVRQTPLVVQVSEQFRGLIESGAWPVGEKIPPENQLVEELGVSRGTVREALRSLSLVGLLEPRVGDGTYVRATDEISGVLVRDLPSSLEHALDARAGLEAAAARLAAQRATPEAIASLQAAFEARDQAYAEGDPAAFLQADYRFHREIVAAGGNPMLIRLHEAMDSLLTWSMEDETQVPEAPEVESAHSSLLRAIVEGDPDTASEASYSLAEAVKRSVRGRP